jgi:hypothetical protein
MNPEKSNFLLESETFFDFKQIDEDLIARSFLRLEISFPTKCLDYLFKDGLYPIEEDRDYRELGEIFTEND